jgi:hypothetical protein
MDNITDKMFKDISVELEEQAGVEKSYDGNVIHLNFNSRTKGNA